MKKRNFPALLILVLLIFSLSSCKNTKNTKETTAETKPQQTAEKVTVSQAAENVMKRKYKEAMYKFCYSHIFPNGEEAEYDSFFGDMSENNFAVYDVDSDGIKELIIKYETASMAGKAEQVYGYDLSTGELYEEFSAFVSNTYFSHGIVKREISHNNGYSLRDDFWPYFLYQYNAETGKYEEIADVDAWEKEIHPNIEGKGNYPDNIDTENYGLVFLIRENGEEKILSKSQYDEWCCSWFEDAEEYTIPYVSISPENIDAM